MSSTVSIIILNWNGWQDTLSCLESLYKITYPNYKVIIIDNNSTDNSVKNIKEFFKIRYPDIKNKFGNNNDFNNSNSVLINLRENTYLILNNENYGFARGNNVGIKFALQSLNSDYVLLLNNDTLVEKNFLNELINVGENNTDIMVLGPKVYPFTNGKIQKDLAIVGSKILFNKGCVSKGIKSNATIDVDMVSGSSMLLKKEILNKNGLLDSIFFFGWEDADFCTKTKRNGYRVVGVSDAKILHKIGASYGNHFSNNPKLLTEAIKNQLIFINRYASFIQKISSIPFFITYLIFIIFRKTNSFNSFITKITSIVKGFQEYLNINQ